MRIIDSGDRGKLEDNLRDGDLAGCVVGQLEGKELCPSDRGFLKKFIILLARDVVCQDCFNHLVRGARSAASCSA